MGVTMTYGNVSYPANPFQVTRTASLHYLLAYALANPHSHLWIGPLSLLLAREGLADER
jgi:hypothetical protein